MNTLNQYQGALLGLAVGDALGVPVEFKPRTYLDQNPVKDMLGYGTYNQPAGTWSDDSSMAFCLAQSLADGFSIQQTADYFVDWVTQGFWSARGEVFDIGISTRMALGRVGKKEYPAELCGGVNEDENGNGSLMRILPLIFHLKAVPSAENRYQLVKDISSITHGHFRSVFSCFVYCEYALKLLRGQDKFEAYEALKKDLESFVDFKGFLSHELELFHRLLKGDISTLSREEIRGSGYVLHSLEASFWTFLNTDNYSDAVLTAVNLGEDTDTTACIVGGLAGLYYGVETIPNDWIIQLAREEDIKELASALYEKYEEVELRQTK